MDTTLTLNNVFMQKYDIKNIIDNIKGGQKNVFIVELNSGKKVVIKIFHSFEVREKKEIEFYKKYEHLSGIPKIIDVSEHSGSIILIEEYINGNNLDKVAATGYYLNNGERVISLIKDIIFILKPMWEDGLIHRDLKPDNIIITTDYKPVIIDFGIAKDSNASTITETGFQPNSWKFASPEQIFAKKDQISYRTDFFSLGVISYYLYYNKLPFGNTKEEVIKQLSTENPFCSDDPDCDIKNFISKICKINPSERPRNVDLLLSLL